MTMLKVYLLGQFNVVRNDEVVEIPSRPAQSLLAYLMLTAGTAHRREKLAGLLWPEASEENARSNLRHALWRLRKAIGSEYFITDKISAAFYADSEYWLDAKLLARQVEEKTSPRELVDTVSVYGGELLPGFYDDWVVLERERFRALYEKKVQMVLDWMIEEERWTEVLEWGERWIAMGYAPEPAYRALMFAYCGLGDTAGMAAAYSRCVKALREDLAVEPSEETKATYERLSKGGKPSAPQWVRAAPDREVDATHAVHALLKQWRAQGKEVLDVASLAIVQANPGGLPFDDEDASLLIRSALHHAIDVSSCLERARTEDVAVLALVEVYESYPKPRVRARIVEALQGLKSETATDALLRVALEDDAAVVRSEAAVSAAKRGRLLVIARELLKEVDSMGGSAAMAALVSVADEVGLPTGIGPYPKLPLGVALAQRRWRANSSQIVKQTGRAALGGALAMAMVADLQLIPGAFINPEIIRQNLEFMELPIWLFSNALLGLIWGGLLGSALGFGLGLADTLWKGRGRFILGGVAGWVHSFFLISLSLFEAFKPEATSSVYIPIYLTYGLLTGVALTLVFPSMGKPVSLRHQIIRSICASGIISLIALPAVYLVYRQSALSALILHLMVAWLFPLGLAWSMSRVWGRTVTESYV